MSTTPAFHIDVARHGESTHNAAGLVTGRVDVPLTATGFDQARALGPSLRGPYDGAFCSSLGRARDTLWLALGAAPGVVPREIKADARLDEIDFGVYASRPKRDLPCYTVRNLDAAPPRGETPRQVLRRIAAFLDDLVFYDYRRTLVVAHSGSLRALIGLVRKVADPRACFAIDVPNAELVSLAWDGHLPGWSGIDP